MAIIEMSLLQTYKGKNCYNVFHFCDFNSTPITPDMLQDWTGRFEAVILPLINAIQVDAVSNVSLRSIQYENPNVGYLRELSGGGELTDLVTAYLPPAQTYAFRLTVAQSLLLVGGAVYTGTRRITNGYKRLTGVSDGVITDGDWLSTFAEGASVDAMEVGFSTDLVPTNGAYDTLVPVVLGKPIDATETKPARPGLFAEIVGASLQPPRWSRNRQ